MTEEAELKYNISPQVQHLLEDLILEKYTNDVLRKYRDLVWYIANDYHELSFEKAVLQRDDWKKRCNKLINELETDNENL